MATLEKMENKRSFMDIHGFLNFEVTTEKGGRVLLTLYNVKADEDLGNISIVNENGLGFSKFINHKNMDEVFNKIDFISWVSEKQKSFMKRAIKDLS